MKVYTMYPTSQCSYNIRIYLKALLETITLWPVARKQNWSYNLANQKEFTVVSNNIGELRVEWIEEKHLKTNTRRGES